MDVYKIGISLALASNAPQVLQALSAQLLHVHAHVHNLQGSMNKLKVAVGGAFAIAGGTAVLGFMGKLVEHGNELVKVQRDMEQAGVSSVGVQEAYAKAWEMTGKHQNVSAVEAMKLINDGRMTFGDQDVATHHAGDFVEMASFLKAYEGGKHAHASADVMREVNAAVKSGELAAKISPEEMGEHIKQMVAMKIAYGEGMKVNTYLTGVRAAGVALRNASDEFRYGVFPALLQENSSTGGVMLMTLFNKVVSGVGNTTKSLEKMTELGLLDKKMLDYDKGGHVKGLHDPGAFKNSMEAAVNMFAWTHDTFKPLLDKKLDDENLTGQARKVREAQYISAYFPNRNASKAITEMLQQFTKLEKDAAQMSGARKAMNMEAYTGGSLNYQQQAFETQWTNFLDVLGAPLVETATESLAKINNILKEFSQWLKGTSTFDATQCEFVFHSYFDLIKNLGIGLGIASVALVGGGAVAILACLGPAGWLVAGLIALAGAAVWLYNSGFAETIKNIGIGLGVLSAALAGWGVAAILAALGPAGWLAAGLMAFFGFSIWAYNNWPTWDGIKSAFTEFISWIGTIPSQIKAFFGFGSTEAPKEAETPVPLPNDSEGGAAFDRPTGPYVKRKTSLNAAPPAEIKSTVASVYGPGQPSWLTPAKPMPTDPAIGNHPQQSEIKSTVASVNLDGRKGQPEMYGPQQPSWFNSLDRSILETIKPAKPEPVRFILEPITTAKPEPPGPTGKQSWNLTPPQQTEIKSTVAAVYLDGRKVGDAVVKHITSGSHGGIEGTPYHDTTMPSSMPFDTAFAIG